MITLQVLFDTNNKESIMRIMHGIETRVAHQLDDKDRQSDSCFTHHFIAGKVDNRQEIDIVDVKKYSDTSEETIIWSDWKIAVCTINTLRTNPHVKNVLIKNDDTENTANFIDYDKPIYADDFREIINPIE